MSLFKSHIVALSAYSPPLEGRNPESHLLLDFNERTLPVAKEVEDALVAYIRKGRLQMYPSYGNVVEQIAQYAGVDSSQLMITNGSDQGIDLVFRAACDPGDEVILLSPSFAMYRQCALLENAKIVEVAYEKDSGFPTDKVLSVISDRTQLIAIANPNNPCGSVALREDLLRIAQAAPEAVLLIDECYFEYCGVTVADTVGVLKNIVVLRTFSKTWGMPSLRLGYLIAASEHIRTLLNIRGPYDINQLAIVAIQAALKNMGDIESYIAEVMKKAKPLMEDFLEKSSVPYWKSGANFIWTFPDRPDELQAHLQKQGILVRPKANAEGRVGLRVTLGTVEQVKSIIAAWKAFGKS